MAQVVAGSIVRLDSLSALDVVRTVTGIICGRSNGLNVCALNARSIRNKVDDFRYVFSDLKLHVVLMCETWLTEEIPSSFISLPGFKLFRRDRSNRRGGGVAVFVRDNLKAKLVFSSRDQAIEFICIEISNRMEKCLLCSVYCPPNAFNYDNAKEFENIMSRMTQTYSNVIVAGDFNVDLCKRDTSSDQFSHLLQMLHLNTVNYYPTYNNSFNPSLLDLLLVSDPDKVILQDQISPFSTLDHDILFLAYDFPVSFISEPKSFSYRDYKNIDLDSLMEECSILPWENLFTCVSVDNQVELFTSMTTYLFERYVPLKTRRVSLNSCPWFSYEVLTLISEREYLYQRYRRIRSQTSRALYKLARNRANAAIKLAKRRYYNSRFNGSLDSKALWRNLRQAGVYGKDHSTCGFNPDELNASFTTLNNATTTPQPSNQAASFRDPVENHTPEINSFSFRRVDYEELALAISSIKSDATGPDNLSPRFIKLLLPLLAKYVLHIMNSCLMSSTFPNKWKVATVIPIAKTACPESHSDFRPISLLCFLSKVLEKLMYRQILTFVEGSSLLTRWQSGFRSSHSCETAVLKISTDIRRALDRDEFTALVLLDFSKAFDCVDHSILICKLLSYFKFDSSSIQMIKDFLLGRSQRVIADNTLSSPLSVVRGVPQGSILGPLLFSLFINDLPSVVHDASVHLYADDVQIYLSRPLGLLEDCIDRINSDLQRIHAWSENNGLQLNPKKSQFISFYSGALNELDIPAVILNGFPLTVTTKVNNLGIVLNHRMKCCDNVRMKLGKIYSGLRRLWLYANILPCGTRLRLVKTLILPHFTYGSLVFPKLDSICSRKIEIAFNDCIRFVFGLRRYDHVSSYRWRLLGCSLNSYLAHLALTFLYRLLNSNKPDYLREFFSYTTSQRNRNITMPRFHRLVMENSYPVQIIRLWNGLPYSIQTAATIFAFRTLVRNHVSD